MTTDTKYPGYYDIWTVLKTWPTLTTNEDHKKILTCELNVDHIFNGNDITIGVLPGSKERKMLFTALQIECLRREILIKYKTKLPSITNELLPSASLIEVLRINSKAEFYTHQKAVKKWNKKHVHAVQTLNSYHEAMDLAKRLRQEKETVFIAIDAEAWEQNHQYITEVGYTIYDSGLNVISGHHIIINEHLSKRNGRYVQDKKDDFIHGESQRMSLPQVASHMTQVFNKYPKMVVIGHDTKQDIDYLKVIKVEFPVNLVTFDTIFLYAARCSDPNRKLSLGRLCGELEIDTLHLHNAGNDAFYTMKAFLILSSPSGSELPDLMRMSLEPKDVSKAIDSNKNCRDSDSHNLSRVRNYENPDFPPLSEASQSEHPTKPRQTNPVKLTSTSDTSDFPSLDAASKMKAPLKPANSSKSQWNGVWGNDTNLNDEWNDAIPPASIEQLMPNASKELRFVPANFTQPANTPISYYATFSSKLKNQKPARIVYMDDDPENGTWITDDPVKKEVVENEGPPVQVSISKNVRFNHVISVKQEDTEDSSQSKPVDKHRVNWLQKNAIRNDEPQNDRNKKTKPISSKIRIVHIKSEADEDEDEI